MKRTIVFRADGNSHTGLGHVYRSLALAEMLQGKFLCSFAIVLPDMPTVTQINSICDELIILPDGNIQTFAEKLKGDEIVVLDGYQFNSEDQKLIKTKGCRLVCIDDLHNQHFVADVVINHSLTVNSKDYSVEPYTKVCTGAEYILVREEFLSATKRRINNDLFRNVFLCFGGVDNNNFSLMFSKHLQGDDNVKNVHVLVGSAFQGNASEIESVGPKIHLYQNLDAKNIVAVMNKCDFAIVAASSVAYECAALGLPLIVGYYLETQTKFYNALLSQKNVWGLGNLCNLKYDKLSALVSQLPSIYRSGESFIDGNQASRYLSVFSEFQSK